MSYLVKEIFFTLQSEGVNTETPAVFCRFAGCNLWSGREEHRSTAVCQFGDTDLVGRKGPGGGKFPTAHDLAQAVEAAWHPGPGGDGLVACTGGEPLLQLDEALVDAFHARRFRIAIETNGTREPPLGIDWIGVSPKAGAEPVLRRGDELKLVYPQPGLNRAEVEDLDLEHFFLQPMDSPSREANTALAVEYCLEHPRWCLSLQTHKYVGIL